MISLAFVICAFLCSVCASLCSRLGDKDKDTDKGLVLVLGLVSDYEKEKGFGSEDFSFLEIGNQHQEQNQRRLRALVYGL
jgi:hypothetical protein